jgi:branched-chain amino acid transport system permease protein
MFDWGFSLALVTNGVLIGLMYSLIALGFVLVYKATDAINFAQGEFVMPVAVIGMVAFGFGLERVVLRPLIGRPIISVIMATIGLASVLRGAAPLFFGAETQALPLPISDEPILIGPFSLPPGQVVGALLSLGFLAAFTWFFLKSRMGVAMRAVADSQQVAMAMGINVERYFAIAWGMAGIVSALGGLAWGALLGVDVHLALVGLKVFPVVILGGLDSVLGAIVGGLIVGVVESLAAGYLDPLVGGGTKDFAPYVLMILMLMIRPYGIFGKRRIERV